MATNTPSNDDDKKSAKTFEPYANMTQEERDAHFYEDGVKADGTGGVAPESE